MMTAHYKNKDGKIVHFKVNSIAEVANILDNKENYINSVSDLLLLDENGIIKKYDMSLDSSAYSDLSNFA